MKASQPLLQSAMVGINVVEVEIRRLRVWFAGRRQNVCGDPGAAREGGNRRAAVAAEVVGRGDAAAEGRGDRHTVQFRQHRIRGCSLPVARDDHRDLFVGADRPRLADLPPLFAACLTACP